MFNSLRPLALMLIAGFIFAIMAGCTNDSIEEGQADATSMPEDSEVRGKPEGEVEPDTGEPTLSVTIDEEKDIVALTANRDMDRASVELAIQLTIHDPAWGGAADYRYGVEWSDDRHALVRFTELRSESSIGFMLDDARTKDGKPLVVNLPYEGRVVTVYAGAPWSGIRWTNAEGEVVREQAFDSAVYVQPMCCSGEKRSSIAVYLRSGNLERLDSDSGDLLSAEPGEWPELTTSRSSDGGVRNLYAYAADGKTYYMAIGLEYIYLMNDAKGTKKLIYRSEDEAIYGLAASPDGSKVAVLTDSERNLGSYADLRIFDETGDLLSHHEKAAYMGHSDGWHFIYPAAWRDNDTVVVPLVGRSEPHFGRGHAIYDVVHGKLAEEAVETLPDEALNILSAALPDWNAEPIELLRASRRPGEGNRYYAALISGRGTYLIDLQEKKASRIGEGALLGWSSDGLMLTWFSSEGQFPEVSY